jgi:hypothetical protein
VVERVPSLVGSETRFETELKEVFEVVSHARKIVVEATEGRLHLLKHRSEFDSGLVTNSAPSTTTSSSSRQRFSLPAFRTLLVSVLAVPAKISLSDFGRSIAAYYDNISLIHFVWYVHTHL